MKTLITPVMMAGLVLSAGCSDTKTDSTASQSTQGQSPAMVAAADPRAVRAGLEVISKGGTAIDAAIAVQSVLGLVEPQSSGIAGGAFLIYLDAESGDVTMYDGRETAPAAATPKHPSANNNRTLNANIRQREPMQIGNLSNHRSDFSVSSDNQGDSRS